MNIVGLLISQLNSTGPLAWMANLVKSLTNPVMPGSHTNGFVFNRFQEIMLMFAQVQSSIDLKTSCWPDAAVALA